MKQLLAAISMLLVLDGCAALRPPTDQEARAAIWNDALKNALIGNYSLLIVGNWLFGHDTDRPPTITIDALACSWTGFVHRCRFEFLREAQASASAADKAEPSRLFCTADLTFVVEKGVQSWTVDHRPPPPGGAHSRTTLECVTGRS